MKNSSGCLHVWPAVSIDQNGKIHLDPMAILKVVGINPTMLDLSN